MPKKNRAYKEGAPHRDARLFVILQRFQTSINSSLTELQCYTNRLAIITVDYKLVEFCNFSHYGSS